LSDTPTPLPGVCCTRYVENQEDEEELMELLDLAMVSVQALPQGMGGVIGLALGIGLVYLVIRILDR
jgi:hypothetical protein